MFQSFVQCSLNIRKCTTHLQSAILLIQSVVSMTELNQNAPGRKLRGVATGGGGGPTRDGRFRDLGGGAGFTGVLTGSVYASGSSSSRSNNPAGVCGVVSMEATDTDVLCEWSRGGSIIFGLDTKRASKR